MAESLQCVQGFERLNIFGVRHLSPAASHDLLALLNKVRPKCVLIEGPADASELLVHLADSRVKPPVALLAYTTELPVDTVLYPLAEYSPEYQAACWASGRAVMRFMDLPAGVLLSLNKFQPEEQEEPDEYFQQSRNLYEAVAQLDKAVHYDDYFEKNFEHNINEGSYMAALRRASGEMRDLLEPMEAQAYPRATARNMVREAYMAMCIQQAIAEGFAPEEIVVVTGAYHAERLFSALPMTKEECALLPKRPCKTTLMPYSFYRLSSRTGYGAGNAAPAYFQMMWECMRDGRHADFPLQYMSELGRHVREGGGYASTASVIEAVRLAGGLAFLKDGHFPTLADLRDAAVACMGHGEYSELAEAFASVEVGTAFGALPEGLSQTPVQDDFNRELRRLKLNKSTVSERLELDLRENTRVQSRESAMLGLERSTFLHRLAFLGICFCEKERANQQDASWRENWVLRWTPEAEIQVVETVLKGETIELAAAFTLKEKLANCADVAEAAQLVGTACICRLTDEIESAISVLARLTADSGDFIKASSACAQLSAQIQYASLRLFDTAPLVPLLERLFLRASLLLVDYASCDDKAAAEAASAINAMHIVSQEHHEIIDDNTWTAQLADLAARDDRNAKLSGLAFAILLERNIADEDFCAKEVSRRLSPGIPADIGAGWFEGMSMRNRYALLSRTGLWQALDAYIQGLDDEEFKRSVVFMRRAFSDFEPREKNSVAELLGELWAMDSEDAAVLVLAPIDESEQEALDSLNDFDFDL